MYHMNNDKIDLHFLLLPIVAIVLDLILSLHISQKYKRVLLNRNHQVYTNDTTNINSNATTLFLIEHFTLTLLKN